MATPAHRLAWTLLLLLLVHGAAHGAGPHTRFHASGAAEHPTTWSGGHAGITLNATEIVIKEVSGSPGVSTHWWITGGNKTHIDNALVRYYVDGEAAPSVAYQVNMAGGTAWVGDKNPCALGNCPEENSNWGNEYIGKGSGMGGWYNDFRVPFSTSLRVTIQSHVRLVTVPDSVCEITEDVDFWGNDVLDLPNYPSADACCAACQAHPDCNAFTYHPTTSSHSPGWCFMKDSAVGARPSPGNVSGVLDSFVLQTGVDYWNVSAASSHPNVPTADACMALCVGACSAFVHRDPADPVNPGTCVLFTGALPASAEVPSSLTVTAGCRVSRSPGVCTAPKVQDRSMFTLVRGIVAPAGHPALEVTLNGWKLPANARLIAQNRAQPLDPLDYFHLVDAPKLSGTVVQTTLSIASGTPNFMEGCFALMANNASFPGEVLATGTEDYYNSGYYFIAAYPQHLPSTGFTYFDLSSPRPRGPFKTPVLWSAYRLHTVDPLPFSNGGVLRWRNGDVADPGLGKCLHEGAGPPVGNPTQTYARALALVYVW